MIARCLIALLALIFLAGCGEKTVVPSGAEKSIVDLVKQQTGYEIKDAKCPSDIPARVGRTFECKFTGPEGPYVAKMRVQSVEGERVVFQINTERAQ